MTELLGDARAQAILKRPETYVSFRPADNRLDSSIGKSVTLPDGIAMEAIGINLMDFSQTEESRVWFFPNGTCDELTLVLHFRHGLAQNHSGIFHRHRVGGTAEKMKMEIKTGQRGQKRAFSLLEVMIAIGIFFMSMFVILSLVSSSLQNARRLQRPMVDAAMIASELSLTNQLVEEDAIRRFRRRVSGLHLDGGHQRSADEQTVSGGLRRATQRQQEVMQKMSVLFFRPQSPAAALTGHRDQMKFQN